jgi:hypothetical protein
LTPFLPARRLNITLDSNIFGKAKKKKKKEKEMKRREKGT